MLTWIELALGLLVMTVSFAQRPYRSTNVLVGALLVSMALGDLLPPDSPWLWVARAAWLAFFFAALWSVPRSSYRAARTQLLFLGAAVACIIFTVIPGMPDILRILVLAAGATLIVASFAVGIVRAARSGA